MFRDVRGNTPGFGTPRYLPTLNRLARAQLDSGQAEEATGTARRAVNVARSAPRGAQHIDDRRDAAAGSRLATGLRTLADCLASAHRHDDASAATGESLRIERELGGDRPYDTADLAKALSAHARSLDHDGQVAEATDLEQQALRYWRVVARVNPGGYGRDLIHALTTLADRLRRLGRHDQAEPMDVEAAELAGEADGADARDNATEPAGEADAPPV